MTTRKYSSRSQQTTLTAALTSSGTSATVVSGTALLGGVTISAGETFTVVIDPDTALEEIVDVTAVSTNTLTITRGVDGSTGQAHSAGAVVRHMAIGRDYREANTHIENSTTAHGLTIADVITTTNTKTLTNKTLTSPTITGTGAIAGTFTGNLTGNVTGNVSGSSGSTTGNAATATALATGRTFQLTGDVEASGVTFDGTGNVSLTTVIGTGAIVNADINASAAIDKTKISGTAITAADTGTVTSAMIANDSIVNADINSSAQIAYSKTNLTNSIVNADINASAAIEWTKIAPSSTVSATELGYLDGVTSAVQTQLDSKLGTSTAASTYAPLASPALTGTPTAPTAAANTNTTQIATTAYVQTELADLVNSAPAALDTLNELAASLGNDANFSTTVTNSLATKLPLAGGTMSGNIAMGTNKITGAGDPTSAQDVATKNYVDTAAIAPSNLTGPITSVGSATAVASQTGTGSTFVMQASPTLTTPNIGVATATSINGTTIPSSKTLVATDSTTYVVPSQTGNSGKFLTTDGTTSSWGNVAGALAQPNEPSSPQDGQIWIDTDGTAPTTVVTRWTKQPAAGTTSLTGNDDYSIPLAYSAGYEQVFLNGVLLSRSGGEYTATNGTSITLTSATVAGDIVEVICPLQIATTDTYTQSAVNNAFQANSNNFAAGKNKIINGDFRVSQRGTTFSNPANFAYLLDRYAIYYDGTGATRTISQQTFTPGTAPVAGYEGANFFRYAQTVAGTSNTVNLIYQRIEDVRTLAGQSAVLSVWLKADSARTVTATARQYFGSGGSADVNTGFTGSASVTTSWQRFSFTISMPSISGKTIGTSSALEIQLGLPSGTTPTIDIWGVQLEAGSTATAFQTATGTIQGELAACQRYYQRYSADGAYSYFGFGSAHNTSTVYAEIPLQVQMRVAPTTLDTSATSTFFCENSASVSTTSLTTISLLSSGTSRNAGVVQIDKSASFTSGTFYRFLANNSTSAYVGFSAEL